MNGVFAVKKPAGPTSHDVVDKLKKLFSRSPEYLAELKSQPKQNHRRSRRKDWIKIGHGGTLDPLADGVLVVGVGKGTKQLQNYLGNCVKRYKAICLFGASTTTYDSDGAILGYGKVDGLTNEQVQQALAQFRGQISQVPPVFSALKMDGKPLYEYARQGIPLPRKIEPRECTIEMLDAGDLVWQHEYAFPSKAASDLERAFARDVTGDDQGAECTFGTGPIVELSFTVSSGTYIRSLIHDLGRALGTQAHMVRLTRVAQGDWVLNKNVMKLPWFDADHDFWLPILEDELKEGPKMMLDYTDISTRLSALTEEAVQKTASAEDTPVDVAGSTQGVAEETGEKTGEQTTEGQNV